MIKSISLRKISLAGLTIYAFLVLLVVFSLQTLFLNKFYTYHKEKSVKSAGKMVAQYLASAELPKVVERLALNNEVCIYILGGEQNLQLGKNKNHCILHNLTYEQTSTILAKINDNGGHYLFSNYRFNESERLSVYGQYVAPNYFVLVSSRLNPLDATYATLRDQFWLVCAVVLSLTWVLSLVLSKRLVKPFLSLQQASSKLPSGQYKSNLQTGVLEMQQLDTVLKEANQQILKADLAKKELLANVSHDLRTPLTMIMGYAEMIQDFPQDAKTNAGIIEQEAKRLNDLVNDLLTVSNQENNIIKLQKEEIKLSLFLADIAKQYKIYCSERNISFSLEINADAYVCFDIKRIKQVLYNFLSNAIYSLDKPIKEIKLRSYWQDGDLFITVVDNGKGIAKEDINYIWQRYYSVRQQGNQLPGSGIGLNLAQRYLKQHDFTYGVHSKLNEGSTFFFVIEKNNIKKDQLGPN